MNIRSLFPLLLLLVAAAPADAQRRGKVAAPAPARVAPQQPPAQSPPAAVAPSIPQGFWFVAHGGKFHAASDPTRPAILLVHGLHQSAHSWLKPSASEKGERWFFDHASKPEPIDTEKSIPGIGIFKVGRSDRLDIDPLNWFDYLVGQGYTVATWSQPGRNFSHAYPSADSAFDQLLAETARLSPGNPPPVALIGHSRGGLVIRQLLKDNGSRDRVKWVVTLHSPHQGSVLAGRPDEACQAMLGFFTGSAIEKEMLRAAGLHHEFRDFCDIVSGWVVDRESKELAPGSDLIRGLAQGEAALPGISYYTFGGTRPTFIRYYVWPFEAISSVPQLKGTNVYYKWKAHPVEITGISPLFDGGKDVAPELRPGHGDGLVTDASARLPFAIHSTTQLNHAEVLWDRALQNHVVGLLEKDSRLGPRSQIGTRR